MLKKMLGGAAVAGTVLAMAIPAQAAGEKRTADWGSNGAVTMSYQNHRWDGEAHFRGLSRGDYEVEVSQELDYNHDGIADSGSASILCRFTVRHSGQSTGCHGRAGNVLGVGDWSDINQATLYRVEGANHVNLDVRDFH